MQKDINQTKNEEEVTKQELDMELDQELEAAFPASAAPKISRSDIQTGNSRQKRGI